MLKVFRCVHCKTRFVVMKTKTFTYLPVEVEDDQQFDDDEVFESSKHKSHLLSCLPRRNDWDKFKRKFEEVENTEITIALSKLLD